MTILDPNPSPSEAREAMRELSAAAEAAAAGPGGALGLSSPSLSSGPPRVGQNSAA